MNIGRLLLSCLRLVGLRSPRRYWTGLPPLAAAGGLVLLCGAAGANGGQRAGTAVSAAQNPQVLPLPSHWITSLVRGNHGNWWIGTEGKGVFRWSPGKSGAAALTGFSTGRHAPENVYALVCDHRGRIWAGSLNHGVCVYNGQSWRDYGPIGANDDGNSGRSTGRMAGPLGARIFGIAVSPLDGSVWIATDMGLAVYHNQTLRWSYITTANGLFCNDLSSIAFAPDGDLFVGTQCHGILAASAADHYGHWRRIFARVPPQRYDQGNGLPGNLINCLLVVPTANGRSGGYCVYAGTDSGLAIGRKNGTQWSYLRGRNYVDKAKGLWRRLPGFFIPPPKKLRKLPSSDYITALAANGAGNIWLAHRATGLDLYVPKLGRVFSVGQGVPYGAGYVACLAVRRNGEVLTGGYESHLYMFGRRHRHAAALSVGHAAAQGLAKVAPFPAGAGAPGEKRLNAIIARVKAGQGKPPVAAFLGDDWRTQGNWLGHYGVDFARLCADVTISEKFCGGNFRGRIIRENSPHTTALGDFDSYVAWKHSKLRRTIYFPDANQRIEGEWNDQGGYFNRFFQGPDMWLRVRVPHGLYRLSFYYHNKDGESGKNDLRDYAIAIYPGGRSPTYTWLHDRPLARARVMQFWGGMYCSFLLHGPVTCQVRLVRNYGFWMAVQGIFLDRIAGRPRHGGYTDLDGLPISNYRPPAFVPTRAIERSAVWRLWKLLNETGSYSRADIPWQRSGRLLAYRQAQANHFPAPLLARWRWKLNLWNRKDNHAFKRAMAELAAPK